MKINYTWPGRFHLIVNGTGGVAFYVTLQAFKRRYHYMKVRSVPVARRSPKPKDAVQFRAHLP